MSEDKPHVSFPEWSLDKYAAGLVEEGYKVEVETLENARKRKSKVVGR